jgi:hypothetical protein
MLINLILKGIVNSDGALWKEQRAFLHTILRKLGAKSFLQGSNCLEHKIRVFIQNYLETICLKTFSMSSNSDI